MVHPAPNRLVRRRHSAFRQQILDVAQAEREPEVKPYCSLNDLRRETIPAVADLVHLRGTTRPSRTPQARSAVTMPDEVRKSFTIGGKPIPPEIFADFGDAMMSDNRPIVVTVDANAAIAGP